MRAILITLLVVQSVLENKLNHLQNVTDLFGIGHPRSRMRAQRIIIFHKIPPYGIQFRDE